MRPLKLPDLSGVTLLVVDDNDDSLRVLGEFLRACGAHVLEARGALTALSYVETQDKVHAIVTDLSMPNMDGVELVQRVRTHPRGRAIPAIALSAHKPERCLILQRPMLRADLMPGRDSDLAEAMAAATPHDPVPILATDPLTAQPFSKSWPSAGPHFQPVAHYALNVAQVVAVAAAPCLGFDAGCEFRYLSGPPAAAVAARHPAVTAASARPPSS